MNREELIKIRKIQIEQSFEMVDKKLKELDKIILEFENIKDKINSEIKTLKAHLGDFENE